MGLKMWLLGVARIRCAFRRKIVLFVETEVLFVENEVLFVENEVLFVEKKIRRKAFRRKASDSTQLANNFLINILTFMG